MNLEDATVLLDRFSDWMDNAGYRQGTRTMYRSALHSVLRKMNAPDDGAGLAEALTLSRSAKHLSTTTKNNYRSAWRLFEQFAFAEGIPVASLNEAALAPPGKLRRARAFYTLACALFGLGVTERIATYFGQMADWDRVYGKWWEGEPLVGFKRWPRDTYDGKIMMIASRMRDDEKYYVVAPELMRECWAAFYPGIPITETTFKKESRGGYRLPMFPNAPGSADIVTQGDLAPLYILAVKDMETGWRPQIPEVTKVTTMDELF